MTKWILIVAAIAIVLCGVALLLVDVIPPETLTQIRMDGVTTRIADYYMAWQKLPMSLSDLPPSKDNRHDKVVDGWGKELIYSRDSAEAFTMSSLGADGAPGGDGKNADIEVSYKLVNGKWVLTHCSPNWYRSDE